MKVVTHELDSDAEILRVKVFSDWHIGDLHCDLNKIKSDIEEAKNEPNCVVILNGDLMNNATKSSVSDIYAEEMSPQRQLNLLCELLEPIKDKIVFISSGNHEDRTARESGVDLMGALAGNLGLLNCYAKEGGILFLKFGHYSLHHRASKDKPTYSFYITHGTGGGRKEGAKAIRLADMACIADCDVYVHAHTHLPMIMKENFYRVDRRSKTAFLVEKLFVNTASSLTYGGYGQSKEFKPASTSSPTILLSGRRNETSAIL